MQSQQSQLLSSQTTQQINKLNILINSVKNNYQKKSLEKIMVTNNNNKLYIHTISINNPPLQINQCQSCICSFKILGSNNYYNHTTRSYERQIYTVNMYNIHCNNYNISTSYDHEHHSFDCSCKDFTTRSKFEKKVCKHICFIICKFGQIFDADYFNSENKILNTNELSSILDKARLLDNFNINDDTLENLSKISLLTESNNYLIDCFKLDSLLDVQIKKSFIVDNKTILQNKEKIDDFICAICCDSNINTLLACPDCSKYIHKECMDIWLNKKSNKNKTCVYCRSNIWNKYT